jgi:hypothetical protein
VAAIELISPSNKDRPEHRSQFASKCAMLLRQGVSLVLVDVVTARNVNLYADLLALIGGSDRRLGEKPLATYAVACRWRPRGRSRWLETWYHEMKAGLPLPCLPLWLTEDLAIPLDLEASYEHTCRDLRIDSRISFALRRQAGTARVSPGRRRSGKAYPSCNWRARRVPVSRAPSDRFPSTPGRLPS